MWNRLLHITVRPLRKPLDLTAPKSNLYFCKFNHISLPAVGMKERFSCQIFACVNRDGQRFSKRNCFIIFFQLNLGQSEQLITEAKMQISCKNMKNFPRGIFILFWRYILFYIKWFCDWWKFHFPILNIYYCNICQLRLNQKYPGNLIEKWEKLMKICHK